LSYANNKAEIDRKRQSMVDSLKIEMTNKLTENENERTGALAGIDSSYKQTAIEKTNEIYGDEWDAYNKEREAEIKAETARLKDYYSYLEKQAENNISNYASDKKDLYAHLQENNTDPDYAAQMIYAYCEKYDIDPKTASGRADLNSLLSAAQLTEGEYKQYIGTGSVYGSAEDYAAGNKNARIKWDYKTAGTQKYKIKVVKDTWNWFNGVDGNAVVNIYYPDGTLLKENVKLENLSEKVGLDITKLTEGSGNNGRVGYINLDLSNENLG
jgi:hypothetical protein